MSRSEQNDKIFRITKPGFEAAALDIFGTQYENNPLYRSYSDLCGIAVAKPATIRQIPFLPINFFKTHAVKTTVFEPEVVFESSGTTGTVNSHHYVKDASLYETSFKKCFESFYAAPNEYCIIGLLPSYLERENSSLVYMVNQLVEMSGHLQSGFYLKEYKALADLLEKLNASGQKTLLIGVTFALLDFAELFSAQKRKPLNNVIIMETGGMKGRREEMVRAKVHEILKNAFGVKSVHSEYGMTELLSQAYSKGEGIFHCPPWMKVMVRDEEDPLLVNEQGSGLINVIDLANIYSCSFIATDDVGKVYEDGSFEILGRKDNSDLRGCSLLVV